MTQDSQEDKEKEMQNIIEDKESGEPRLSHRIDLSTGFYNGKQIIKKKETIEKKDN